MNAPCQQGVGAWEYQNFRESRRYVPWYIPGIMVNVVHTPPERSGESVDGIWCVHSGSPGPHVVRYTRSGREYIEILY